MSELAKIAGQSYDTLPEDLFIPPEALRVLLEAFEGPLDLLLYLIRKHHLDILLIDVAEISHQYMHYLDLMHELELDLAGEYLVMAALLTEIKSRSLLPRPIHVDEQEADEDPRAELIQRLLNYERFKTAAQRLDQQPRLERDVFLVQSEPPLCAPRQRYPDVTLDALLLTWGRLLRREETLAHHAIRRESLSTRARINQILLQLHEACTPLTLAHFFTANEGRAGLVVVVVALLELMKEHLVLLTQTEDHTPIDVRLIEPVIRLAQNDRD